MSNFKKLKERLSELEEFSREVKRIVRNTYREKQKHRCFRIRGIICKIQNNAVKMVEVNLTKEQEKI